MDLNKLKIQKNFFFWGGGGVGLGGQGGHEQRIKVFVKIQKNKNLGGRWVEGGGGGVGRVGGGGGSGWM